MPGNGENVAENADRRFPMARETGFVADPRERVGRSW
jgi:hypothetical protein